MLFTIAQNRAAAQSVVRNSSWTLFLDVFNLGSSSKGKLLVLNSIRVAFAEPFTPFIYCFWGKVSRTNEGIQLIYIMPL